MVQALFPLRASIDPQRRGIRDEATHASVERSGPEGSEIPASPPRQDPLRALGRGVGGSHAPEHLDRRRLRAGGEQRAGHDQRDVRDEFGDRLLPVPGDGGANAPLRQHDRGRPGRLGPLRAGRDLPGREQPLVGFRGVPPLDGDVHPGGDRAGGDARPAQLQLPDLRRHGAGRGPRVELRRGPVGDPRRGREPVDRVSGLGRPARLLRQPGLRRRQRQRPVHRPLGRGGLFDLLVLLRPQQRPGRAADVGDVSGQDHGRGGLQVPDPRAAGGGLKPDARDGRPGERGRLRDRLLQVHRLDRPAPGV